MTSCKVKYEEGFVQTPTRAIVTKPEYLWTQADKDLVLPAGKNAIAAKREAYCCNRL